MSLGLAEGRPPPGTMFGRDPTRPVPPRPFRFLAVLLVGACGPISTASAQLSTGLLRVSSGDFRRIDDRLAELRAAPPPFRPPPGRSSHLGFHSRISAVANAPRWVQVDLGTPRPIDTVVVVPAGGDSFPPCFRVEVADRADFRDAVAVCERSDADAAPPATRPVIVPTARTARYVRFTATRLPGRGGVYRFAVAELMALSGERNLAAGRPVASSDSVDSPPEWGSAYLVDGQSPVGPPLGPAASPTNGFHGAISRSPTAETWVQIDLGAPFVIDDVRLIPALPRDFPDRSGFGFPARYRVETSDDPDFATRDCLLDATTADVPNPGDGPVTIPGGGAKARYLRVTATKLWERTADYVFALAEVQVYAGGGNVAAGRPVRASDSIENARWGCRYLTDGFASQYQLVGWPAWVEETVAAAARADERQRVEAEWAAAREAALVSLSKQVAGAFAAAALIAVWLVRRARTRHRRETELLRDRVARDLHDEIGSNLGGILLLAEAAKAADPEQARRDLDAIATLTRQTGGAMHDIVWLLARGPDTGPDLLDKLRETADKLLRGIGLTFEAEPGCVPRRPTLEFKRQILLAFKEAIHNAARHANATKIAVRCRRDGPAFVLEVEDDGRGIDGVTTRPGTGLRSMAARAKSLGGSCDILPGSHGGTLVRFRVPA